MSALSRRSFLQSSALVAGAAAVVGPAARALATDKQSPPSSASPSSSSSSSIPAPADGGGQGNGAAGPIIAYVNGATVTILSGEREITRDNADLARRIANVAAER